MSQLVKPERHTYTSVIHSCIVILLLLSQSTLLRTPSDLVVFKTKTIRQGDLENRQLQLKSSVVNKVAILSPVRVNTMCTFTLLWATMLLDGAE